jgi:hypothetical protein
MCAEIVKCFTDITIWWWPGDIVAATSSVKMTSGRGGKVATRSLYILLFLWFYFDRNVRPSQDLLRFHFSFLCAQI